MTSKNRESDIKELLSRGVAEFYDPEGSFRKKLTENPKGVVIKLGVDPTKPDIHLGHAVILRKLRKFQDLGCKVIFLVGDYTAQIGDPSGKSKVRPDIELAEVEANAKTYIEQVGKILNTDEKVFAWIRNSDWFYGPTDIAPDPSIDSINLEIDQNGKKANLHLSRDSFLGKALYFENTRMQKRFNQQQLFSVTLRGLLWTMKHITYARLIQRDMFQERIKKGEELYTHELLYPILQGIDSYILAGIFGSCDLEIGGTDQTFNMLMGRDVMRANKVTPQAVMSCEVLEGLDGKEKMSKSLDNYIAITDLPNDMYGKVMSVPDNLIGKYFRLATYTPLPEIEEFEEVLEKGKENPRDIKMRLAREITEIYHGREKAKEAEENFINTFSKKEIPTDTNVVEVTKGTALVEILLETGIVPSKTEFRRLAQSGAVELMESNTKIEDTNFLAEEGTYRVGKKRFLKIKVK